MSYSLLPKACLLEYNVRSWSILEHTEHAGAQWSTMEHIGSGDRTVGNMVNRRLYETYSELV